jgi:hypothetical protein
MTREERQQLKALFVATSLYYGQEIHDQALELYVSDLEDLPFAGVTQAMKDLRREVKTTRCPLPAAIRAKLNPTVDPEAHAALISNEIVEAIGRVGPYYTPEFSPEAAEVVRLEGGWQRVCEVVTNDNLSIYKAQWRQLAKSVIGGERSVQRHVSDQRRSGGGELTAIGACIQAPPEESL